MSPALVRSVTLIAVTVLTLLTPARAQATFCNDVDGNTLWCPCQQPPQAGALDGCANSCTDGGLMLLVSAAPSTLRVNRTCRFTTVVLLRSPDGPGLPALGGNGLRCLRAFSTVSVAVSATTVGEVDFVLPPQPPGTHYYQAWYRDKPGHCLGNGSNMTNGVIVP